MHSIRADKEKNRLYLTFGELDAVEEMVKVAEEIREACKDLRPGFTCLTDLRDFEPLDEQYEYLITGVQEFLVNAGVSEVVRVVRKFGTWGHIQFDKSSMNVGYRGRYVNDLQEAMDLLDGKTS